MPPDLTQPLTALPHALELPPVPRAPVLIPVHLRPPGSKSLTNRALLLAALAEGESTLTGALVDADDAQRMLAAVQTLGAKVAVEGTTVRITGVAGRWKVPADGVTIDLNNAGTATRFLAASVLASPAPITVTGNARMQQRPIGELIATLERLGVKAEYLATPGCPPVRLTPPAAAVGESAAGRTVEIPTTQSSQFISALLLVGSALPGGLTVRLTGDITSASYIRMTIGQLDQLGVRVKSSEDLRVIRVEPSLRRFVTDIEPDASAACFWWAAGALRPDRRIFVDAIPAKSLQGDADFPAVLESMGCTIQRHANAVAVIGPQTLRPVMADLKDMPDAGPALSVVGAHAAGRSILRGVRTLRVKETDRIAAIAAELAKVGSTVTGDLNNDPDAMAIDPIPADFPESPVAFDTYDDHRMAMSLALVSLRRPSVVINDPQCVAKTYPNYWQHWHQAFLV
ncbi:MAG: 3-phosphoshikimate 1-carboxyvinyltransferase [Phycisphaerales bacterium]|nr:3-phosphoshikimate 1-carboxyvinyltransferase [Planctomycetota bacterium]MCH8507395.1 3-phosphoshikimate 1-carboxyvinyltransferase [Phycisphaerales bacterium]